MTDYQTKPVMNWTKHDVSDWISSVAREKEMPECGSLFEEKDIDGQKLWDYHCFNKLKDLNVPTVGLKLTIGKKILNMVSNDYQ